MMTREQQDREIATIKVRTFKVSLSDADLKRLSEKCKDHDLTVSELFESFVSDLVNGTYSNGSDERRYIEDWFYRVFRRYK